jgi:catechol 2,3-dioxygenase
MSMFNPLNLKIDHVHLNVSNLEKSLQFYRSILGFSIPRKNHKTALLSTSIDDNNSQSFLVALSESNEEDLSTPQNRQKAGMYHFAILLPGRKFLSLFLRHIREKLDPQYYEGMADHGVSESIYIHDPDFNGIEVYTDRSPLKWKWANGRVQMITEPLDTGNLLKESTATNLEWHSLPQTTSIGHVHLHVSDLGKANTFYNEVLGLNHTATYPGAYFFASNRYHHHIATNTWLGENISSAGNNELGLDHFAINLNDIGEIRLLKDHFSEFRIDTDEQLIESDTQFASSFYAYDFDGIRIQFLHNN